MTFAYFIEDHDGKILLCESVNQNKWDLPHIDLNDHELEDGNESIIIDKIQQKCDELKISIDITDVIEDSDNLIVFNTYLNECVYDKSNAYSWIDLKDLNALDFSDLYQGCIEKILMIFQKYFEVGEIILSEINRIADLLQIEVNPQVGPNSISIFVGSDYGIYCPYIFSLKYQLNEDGDISFFHTWPILRMFAEGDKTDLYVLLANIMALILKIFSNESISIDYLSLFDPVEFNTATIVFQPIRSCSVSKVKKVIEDLFMKFVTSLFMFDGIIGSFSLKRDDNGIEAEYCDHFEKTENYNWFSRKEHNFYFNADKEYFLLSFKSDKFTLEKLYAKQEWEFIEGIDGKILYQHNNEYDSFHFVSYDNWRKVEQILSDFAITEYTITCQNNHLYILQGNKVWIFIGDYREFWVDKEKEKILNRQTLENRILNFNRKFSWRFPVDSGRFEELISDLLETDSMIDNVRLVGKSNNADGGRDLLIYKRHLVNENNYVINLYIGQCKAYKRSVNKSHITDIRDMLEYYSASGFFLATTSNITAPLIDHQMKLQENYIVDW